VPDEHRDEKIVQGCEVYARAPERAKHGERTISMDELTGVQALERKHPDLPMLPGHVLRWEFEYIRHGILSWFINFDVVTGHVIEPSWGPTRTEEDALAHLQGLIASGAPIEHGGEFDQPLRTHVGLVFSSLDGPDRSPLPEARLHLSASAGAFTDSLST
jgi:hypothetical protein